MARPACRFIAALFAVALASVALHTSSALHASSALRASSTLRASSGLRAIHPVGAVHASNAVHVVGAVGEDRPDFDRMRRQQAQTDRIWRAASASSMRMEKIAYRSRAGDLSIPAFVFLPLQIGGPKSRAALVWVHEDVRGHLYEHHIPFVREAVANGFIVIAPEYRGSIGYGRTLYDAIDYGGREVEDVVTAAEVVKVRYSEVDPDRIGIIGWSHGGMITLLSIFRHPAMFRAAAAIAPVTNLFQRFAWKGVERQRALVDPANRLGGPPADRRDVYKERSPLFQVDKLRIPLLVHVARNDQDVTIEESLPLVDALRSRKAALTDVKVYEDPPGGHLFDRRVDPRTWQPDNTPDQRDSWSRVWALFERELAGLRRDEAPAVNSASR